jgi:hypothetical protein
MTDAREEVLLVMLDGNDTPLEYYGGEENERKFWADRKRCRAENEQTLDAYRAAVRAETLREVRGVVQGTPLRDSAKDSFLVRASVELLRSDILNALDALAQPEAE